MNEFIPRTSALGNGPAGKDGADLGDAIPMEQRQMLTEKQRNYLLSILRTWGLRLRFSILEKEKTMRLIDELKKLRDECKNEEEYYSERFDLWMRYKGKSWPELPSDAAACQSVGAIRSELDRIIAEYQPDCGAKMKGENCNDND